MWHVGRYFPLTFVKLDELPGVRGRFSSRCSQGNGDEVQFRHYGPFSGLIGAFGNLQPRSTPIANQIHHTTPSREAKFAFSQPTSLTGARFRG